MSRNGRTDGPPGVAILGGGVIGITTAIYLELAGYDTAVYAARIPFESGPHPTFATPYAAASIQPASVTMSDLSRVLGTSQEVFGLLAEAGTMGVRRQPHYVLYGEDRPDPDYVNAVEGFRRLSTLDQYPHPPDADAVFGWRFDAYFAEMPAYMARCYGLYDVLGGTVHVRRLDRQDFLDLPGEVLVDCAGLGAAELFEDPRPWTIHVGHQVLAGDLPVVHDGDGRLFSYNYTLDADAGDEGTDGEVYAYPRMDALVLGGSRIRVPLDGEGWDGTVPGPVRRIDGVTVPARIVDVNDGILDAYANVSLADASLTARYGFRPVRDPDGEGVRVERERLDGRPVVHNCGHGGAGVTLSWGSAADAAELVGDVVEPVPEPVTVPREFAVAERIAALIRSR